MSKDEQLKPLSPVGTRLVDARVELVNKVWGESPKLYNHAVLCSVGLPYRNLGDGVRSFQRTSGKTSLRMEAGALPSNSGFQGDIQVIGDQLINNGDCAISWDAGSLEKSLEETWSTIDKIIDNVIAEENDCKTTTNDRSHAAT